MPELPEVQTIVDDLSGLIVGRTIIGVKFATRSVWRNRVPKARELVKSRIMAIERKGKNIIVNLSNGRSLIVHLKMTGRLIYINEPQPLEKHTHLTARLNRGELRFNDVRRFGYLDIVKTGHLATVPYLAGLGPDPMKTTRNEFVSLIRSKKRIIKSLLMDQNVISGIGNIYSDEALFLAGISPRKASSRLSTGRISRLYYAVNKTLRKAIRARGSSVDSYVDGRGGRGSYQDHFLVYAREGESCHRCGRPIKRTKIGGRSCHYCPNCQK